jgi:hypothetical protein
VGLYANRWKACGITEINNLELITILNIRCSFLFEIKIKTLIFCDSFGKRSEAKEKSTVALCTIKMSNKMIDSSLAVHTKT